jgi:hypothetical protein
MSEHIKIIPILHFFIGILMGALDDSGGLTYTYWFSAGMYYVAKWYVKGLRRILCPKHNGYFNLVYLAAAIVIAISALTLPHAPLLKDPIFAATLVLLPSLLIMHFICFLALCILYFFIRIPINIHRRRVEAQRRREEEFAAKLAYEERRRIDAERERQTRESAARQSSDFQRRIDARADCELFYDQHLKEVGKRFPREMFQSFMEKYLSDAQPVEAVERRAKELRRVIQHHRDAAKPPAKFQSVQEVTDWFLHEKQSIESLSIDDEVRQEQLSCLDQRYSELTQHMLEKIGS